MFLPLSYVTFPLFNIPSTRLFCFVQVLDGRLEGTTRALMLGLPVEEDEPEVEPE
jgi:hypothetical protein